MPRHLADIDQEAFEGLCGIQCTKFEICDFFDVTDKTLENWCKRTYKKGFSEVFAIKRGRGKVSLRRSQFRLAESNATMAIWLGKQYLGQRDEVKLDAQTKNELTIRMDRDTCELAE